MVNNFIFYIYFVDRNTVYFYYKQCIDFPGQSSNHSKPAVLRQVQKIDQENLEKI